ncbi:MAG: glycosyltransferase family 2 protein [Maricaulaceae bacterium]
MAVTLSACGSERALEPPQGWDVRFEEPVWPQDEATRCVFEPSAGLDGLPAGWWRVRLVRPPEDLPSRPWVNFDMGAGFGPQTSLPLSPAAQGDYEAIARLPSTAGRLSLSLPRASDALEAARLEVTQIQGPALMAFWLRKAWRLWRRDPRNALQTTIAGLRFLRARHFAAFDTKRAPETGDYDRWVARYGALTDPIRERLAAQRAAMVDPPLISILTPVFNPSPEWLSETLRSIRHQAYPHWELCAVDDGSTDPAVRAVLEAAAAEEPRIRVTFRETNGRVAQATNTALAMARGRILALLDHDDVLAEAALHHIAMTFYTDPTTKIVYTDEDKIDEAGQRFDPYFKPDFNPDLILSQNYFNHLTAFDANLVRRLGGWRDGFDGAQDYDLVLRAVEQADGSAIKHVPLVLYHWRASPGSTARDIVAKPYAVASGEKALQAHLDRTGAGAQAKRIHVATYYRVRWPLPKPAPSVCVIVPTRDRVDLLRACVRSVLERTDYPTLRLRIVDNQSQEPETLDYLRDLGRQDDRVAVMRYNAPFNFSAINNAAAEQCDADVLVLLNNDVEAIEPDWLTEMVSQLERPGVGAVGAKLCYADDTVQHGGVITGVGGVAGHAHKFLPRDHPGPFGRAVVAQTVSAVTGACLAVRRKTFLSVGGLDAERFPVAFNDVDFCLRLEAEGLRTVYTPHAVLRHRESASRGSDMASAHRDRFLGEIEAMHERWGDRLAKDPYYSPNLTLRQENFSIADEPRVDFATGAALDPEPWRRSV